MATEARITELIERMDKLLVELGEHVDHVQLLATWNEEGKTYDVARGLGNWYARQGLAHMFIHRDQAQDSAVELAKVLPREGD